MSLATLAHDQPLWTNPTIDAGPTDASARKIVGRQLGHPLLADPVRVSNDVEIGPAGSFVLVTGSNMSGKSTLLRAVGLNVILAQAGALDGLLAKIGQPLDAVVQLDVGTDLLVERIAGRAQAEGRADDNPESVRKRLQVYNDSTAPVIGFYENRGTLARVDGVGSMEDITARVLGALKKA